MQADRRLFLAASIAAAWPWRAQAAAAPAPAMLLGQPAQSADGDSLRDEVLQALLDRYVQARGIQASPAEIDAYLANMRRTLQRDRDRALAQRKALTRRLAGTGLSDGERQALSRELEDATGTVKALDEALRSADDPADAEARRYVAAAFIVHWKTQRALYRQYGGRIVYQQGGPEPLDALRRFLEQRQASGDFAIADAALAAAFWRYFRDDSLHSFYPRGSRQEAQAFAAPPWQQR